jgi:putative redox protein
MDLQSTVSWRDGMAFDAELDGFSFSIDADPRFGGAGAGPKPKGLTLTSLAGCTAMDVVAILGKMKVKPDSFQVHVGGDLADAHPKKFDVVAVRYVFTGDVPADKIVKAVKLSEERYCGVFATLRGNVEFTTQIEINGELIDS